MIVVVDLASRSHFFVGAAMDLNIDGTMGLAIDKTVLIETDVTVGFSELSL